MSATGPTHMDQLRVCVKLGGLLLTRSSAPNRRPHRLTLLGTTASVRVEAILGFIIFKLLLKSEKVCLE